MVTKEFPSNHYRTNDFEANTITNVITPNNVGVRTNNNRDSGNFTIPYMILVASSGTVRWHGSLATSKRMQASWKAAIKKVLAVDPGIQARRAAEDAYIKSKSE